VLLTTRFVSVGGQIEPATEMLPNVFRLLAFQPRHGESVGKLVAAKVPPKAPLKSWNVSPGCKGPPRLVTVSAPP
jgi:hypothetical protein